YQPSGSAEAPVAAKATIAAPEAMSRFLKRMLPEPSLLKSIADTGSTCFHGRKFPHNSVSQRGRAPDNGIWPRRRTTVAIKRQSRKPSALRWGARGAEPRLLPVGQGRPDKSAQGRIQRAATRALGR